MAWNPNANFRKAEREILRYGKGGKYNQLLNSKNAIVQAVQKNQGYTVQASDTVADVEKKVGSNAIPAQGITPGMVLKGKAMYNPPGGVGNASSAPQGEIAPNQGGRPRGTQEGTGGYNPAGSSLAPGSSMAKYTGASSQQRAAASSYYQGLSTAGVTGAGVFKPSTYIQQAANMAGPGTQLGNQGTYIQRAAQIAGERDLSAFSVGGTLAQQARGFAGPGYPSTQLSGKGTWAQQAQQLRGSSLTGYTPQGTFIQQAAAMAAGSSGQAKTTTGKATTQEYDLEAARQARVFDATKKLPGIQHDLNKYVDPYRTELMAMQSMYGKDSQVVKDYINSLPMNAQVLLAGRGLIDLDTAQSTAGGGGGGSGGGYFGGGGGKRGGKGGGNAVAARSSFAGTAGYSGLVNWRL